MKMTPARRVAGVLFVLAACAAAAACSGSSGEPPAPAESPPPPAASPANPPLAARAERPRVVCLGDSLTAGLGLASTDQAYPALLEGRLKAAGFEYQVINAGVSGDTSAGGLRRLDWSLQGDVRVLIVALGANDGLRGLPPSELQSNLETIVSTAQKRQVRVLLLGMEAPPNLGAAYTRDFRAVYRRVAADRYVPLIPFFLEGVAGIGKLNQADGIHPTEEGQRRIADTIWRDLEPIVRSQTS
jgi:acyl-CoA thioesterase-1